MVGAMDARRLWLMILGAAWAMAWAGSFLAWWLIAPRDGEPGIDRLTAFLGWQAVAGMLAVAVFGAGRGWPARHPVRRWSLVPLGLAALLVVALIFRPIWAGA